MLSLNFFLQNSSYGFLAIKESCRKEFVSLQRNLLRVDHSTFVREVDQTDFSRADSILAFDRKLQQRDRRSFLSGCQSRPCVWKMRHICDSTVNGKAILCQLVSILSTLYQGHGAAIPTRQDAIAILANIHGWFVTFSLFLFQETNGFEVTVWDDFMTSVNMGVQTCLPIHC